MNIFDICIPIIGLFFIHICIIWQLERAYAWPFSIFFIIMVEYRNKVEWKLRTRKKNNNIRRKTLLVHAKNKSKAMNEISGEAKWKYNAKRKANKHIRRKPRIAWKMMIWNDIFSADSVEMMSKHHVDHFTRITRIRILGREMKTKIFIIYCEIFIDQFKHVYEKKNNKEIKYDKQ